MPFFRRLDPFAARNPEEMEIMMDRVPRKLVFGLAKGALMLVVAGLLTLGIAGWLQKHAHEHSQRLTAERNAQIGPQVDREPMKPGAARSLPSPGPNPTPAEPR